MTHPEALFRVGEAVSLRDSCQPDVGTFAWTYIRTHRQGVVKGVFNNGTVHQAHMYAVEFPHDFEGGHDCCKTARRSRGQFISEQHLELENFEASREARTVPNLTREDLEDLHVEDKGDEFHSRAYDARTSRRADRCVTGDAEYVGEARA